MIKNVVVEVDPRTEKGKNAARRLRKAGKVPGIVYGMGRPPFSVAASPKRLEEILHLESGRNTIFKLALTGADQSRAVMIRDLQRDPVTDQVVHVDFVRVDLEKAVTVKVPIRIVGLSIGVKNEGGVVEFVTRHVEVECLPEDIPEHFDVDVTELHISQHLSVSDLTVGPKVKLLEEADTIVVVIAAPKAEETPAVVEGAVAATPAEPEVIKKGKEAAGTAEADPKDKAKDKPKDKK